MFLTKEKDQQLRELLTSDEDDFLVELCAILEEAGVQTVNVAYSGSGDSGAIDAVDIVPSPTCVSDQKKFRDVVEEFVYHSLENHQPGWEINDGAQGTVTIDVANRHANFDHGNNYTGTEDEPWEVGRRD